MSTPRQNYERWWWNALREAEGVECVHIIEGSFYFAPIAACRRRLEEAHDLLRELSLQHDEIWPREIQQRAEAIGVCFHYYVDNCCMHCGAELK